MNLGWKLAAEVNGTAAPWLLDGYERERRPIGEQVVKNSCAQEELAAATTPDQMAVRELLAEMLAEHPEANRTLAERVSGLAIAYPAEEGAHPLAGHRAPDLELDRSSGPARLFELFATGTSRSWPGATHPPPAGSTTPSTGRRPRGRSRRLGRSRYGAGTPRRVLRLARTVRTRRHRVGPLATTCSRDAMGLRRRKPKKSTPWPTTS